MKSDTPIYTYIALLLAVLFWGLSFIATKIALVSFPPFTLIFFRFGTASLFFLIFFWKKGLITLSRKQLKSMLLLAIMQPGLYFTFETLGLKYTSATKTSLILATIPVVILTLSALFLKERIRLINYFGIFLSLAGVALLVFGNPVQIDMGGNLFGDLLIVGAVLAASLYMILARHLSASIPSFQITGMQIIFGAVLFFPAFLWELPSFRVEDVSGNGLIALIGLTLFATIGAFLCYNYALTKISASRASVCINGIPLVTAIGAWLILGESLTNIQFVGAAIVLVSVFLANQGAPDGKDALQSDCSSPARSRS